ncbi:MAG: hypothetical protein Q8L85_09080 [Alphaproteobacteria bacterium]|nr:hypothetical protein [Alphaproteobacteria bacterium]
MKKIFLTILTLYSTSIHSYEYDNKYTLSEAFEGAKKEYLTEVEFFSHSVGPVINRPISDFKGKELVIGAGWAKEYLSTKDSLPDNILALMQERYTIDVTKEMYPDLQGSITQEKDTASLPSSYFNMLFFEHIPCGVFFSPGTYKNIYRLLKDDAIAKVETGVACREYIHEIIKLTPFKNSFKEIIDEKMLSNLDENSNYFAINGFTIKKEKISNEATFPTQEEINTSVYKLFPEIIKKQYNRNIKQIEIDRKKFVNAAQNKGKEITPLKKFQGQTLVATKLGRNYPYFEEDLKKYSDKPNEKVNFSDLYILGEDNSEKIDYLGSIANNKSIKNMPKNRFKQIIVSELSPCVMLTQQETYANAHRILKNGGKLISKMPQGICIDQIQKTISQSPFKNTFKTINDTHGFEITKN